MWTFDAFDVHIWWFCRVPGFLPILDIAGEANKGWATSMRNLKRALINNDLSQQLDESFSAGQAENFGEPKGKRLQKTMEEFTMFNE